MSIHDMRCFMRDDTLQHIGTLHFVDQTIVDKDRIIAHDKGIQPTVVDDQHLHPCWAKARCAQNWRGNLLKRIFRIGVA